MKKIYNWTLILVTMLTVGFSFTSCDEDYVQAEYLSGQWRGDFGMYYKDRFGFEWDADYTIIEFYNNGWGASGSGRQYDYYRVGPYQYQYYKFTWKINNGVIYLHYPSDPDLDVAIYDYQMTYGYFSGFFGNTPSKFRLAKYEDFNWNSYSTYGDYYGYYNQGYYYDGYYYDDYYYDDYYYGYYSKTRGAVNDSTAAATDNSGNGLIVKRGNRFIDNK